MAPAVAEKRTGGTALARSMAIDLCLYKVGPITLSGSATADVTVADRLRLLR
jgi:hypothetical protein